MNRLLKKLSCALAAVVMMITVIPASFPITADAATQTIGQSGSVYEFGKKSDYEIDSSSPTSTTDVTTTLSALSISGDIINKYTKDGMPAYELADDSEFSIIFKYIDKLKNADQYDWHLTEDGDDEVNGIELDDDIDYGAIILQTSFDAKKWVTVKTKTNVKSDITFGEDNGINSVQLSRGCYYRVIVAYKLEKRLDDTSILFIDTSDYEYKKVAEVYRFYAGYKNDQYVDSGKKFYYNTLDYTKGTKDNDYVGSVAIDKKDPHYGWELGSFCISGYTDTGDTDPAGNVYLKTVGNKIKLTYKLEQDIDQLNGNKDLQIERDKSGSDGAFQIKAHDMGRGELIIKHTNEEGISTIREYSNYLEALAYPGADTTIQLFEEGDYEIHLDYAITDYKGWDTTTYYRQSFKFKIRNGNCMVYIFDSQSGAELSNGDVTENGFRIDTARSSYPKITIKKEILNNTANGLVEDTRFNRPAIDGEIFSDEGIYTITAHNRYDSFLDPAVKTIYVGSNNILMAYTRYLNSSEPYTIAQLNEMVEAGYTISEDGEIVGRPSEPESSDSDPRETAVTTTSEPEAVPAVTEIPDSEASADTKADSDDSNPVLPIVGGAVGAAALGAVIAVLIQKKKKA